MKVYVVFLFLYITSTIYSVRIMKGSIYDRDIPLDDGEFSDFQKLLNKFNLLSSTKSQGLRTFRRNSGENNLDNRKTMGLMRFTETKSKVENDDPDTTVIDIKFPDENNGFLESNGIKDKELKRMETLNNGLVVYNNKKTVNVETPDYSYLYFDLLDNSSQN